MNHSDMSNQSIIACLIDPIPSSACESYFAWLTRAGDRPGNVGRLSWMIGHFDDGVTWGRLDGSTGAWMTGDEVAPSVSPRIRRETLQAIRLFGNGCEVLIWRTASELRGRVVVDEQVERSRSDPFAPAEELRIIRGDDVQAALGNGFTHVTDVTGARQVLPIPVTKEELRKHRIRLLVRHFFQQDKRTGAVRVALTRLVALDGGPNVT